MRVAVRRIASFNPRARGGRDPHRCMAHRADAAVSIHAPAGGATGADGNTRRYRGVSIHAPAGGATQTSPPTWRVASSFNPRARGGRDCRVACSQSRPQLFQSTRPRGARLMVCFPPSSVSWVSIHAPAGGATRPARGNGHGRGVSIHAPAGGATPGR